MTSQCTQLELNSSSSVADGAQVWPLRWLSRRNPRTASLHTRLQAYQWNKTTWIIIVRAFERSQETCSFICHIFLPGTRKTFVSTYSLKATVRDMLWHQWQAHVNMESNNAFCLFCCDFIPVVVAARSSAENLHHLYESHINIWNRNMSCVWSLARAKKKQLRPGSLSITGIHVCVHIRNGALQREARRAPCRTLIIHCRSPIVSPIFRKFWIGLHVKIVWVRLSGLQNPITGLKTQ